ncbi:MAG: dipeptidase PepE [Flavobacteriales bacterium]|nr:MAG: dipeptidase PepE [Flavobacteriales bacterium]
MKLLLSSNSTLHKEPYLQFCKEDINLFLAENNAKKVVFIPFAAVTFSYDQYLENVQNGLDNNEIEITSIHQYEDKINAIKDADAIMVGGGNSFKLLNEVYENELLNCIQEVVKKGTPYIGWSAGSNLACPTVKTTNDMPIICPPSFNALNLVPFQINPHYIHGNPPGHNGETREQRLLEFLEVNPTISVIGLREGTMLEINGNNIKLIGNRDARIFIHQQDFYELNSSDDFSSFLN